MSFASIWEIAIKAGLWKLSADVGKVVSEIAAQGFVDLAITAQHSLAVRTLPMHPTDPFDRVLVTEATLEALRLLTVDKCLQRYGELVLMA